MTLNISRDERFRYEAEKLNSKNEIIPSDSLNHVYFNEFMRYLREKNFYVAFFDELTETSPIFNRKHCLPDVN